MEGLLLQSDTAVIPLFEQHADSLLASLGPQGPLLARQLRGFDFDAALLTLRALHGDDVTAKVTSGRPSGTTKRDKGLNH